MSKLEIVAFARVVEENTIEYNMYGEPRKPGTGIIMLEYGCEDYSFGYI